MSFIGFHHVFEEHILSSPARMFVMPMQFLCGRHGHG